VALGGAESSSRQSVGFVAGSIQGRTDLAGETGEQARFFVRRDLGSRWSAEGGGGFGRLNGKAFATDLGLIDIKLLFLPLRFSSWQVHFGTGVGMVAHSIEQGAPSTTGFDPEGWGVAIPSSVGLQMRLRDSLALEFCAGYVYTLRDDLEGAATKKGNDGFWSAGIGLVIGDFGRRSAAHLPIKRFEPSSVLEAVALDQVVTAPDRDGDGLTDEEETHQYFTNPVMADSDADGVDDLTEVRSGTDPNRLDGHHGELTVTEPKQPVSEVPPATALEFHFEAVGFPNGGYTLTRDAQAYLRRVALHLQSTRDLLLVLRGYSDSIGSARSNWRLSGQRCSAVAEYLVGQGIPGKRLILEPLGEQDPAAPNSTPHGRAQNRRVELIPR
jgi:outer membrane protein OmpA-like peptidoglycan-associated protein